ncbi:lamin tail domain-containing protein [Oceaniferula spumae]|uniref:lamin tail domain-containing protein n=1 Tax=Oceaniferula spumae TaxID=2979115 RepID=UPI003F4F1BE0
MSIAGIASAQSTEPIDLSVGTAAQSTTLDDYDASHAIDGVSNFTHTIATDDDPTWQVLLPSSKTFNEITLVNRGGNGSWTSRLRDITVQVIDFNGNVNNDFDGGTVVYSSPLLNPNNVENSPASITVNVGAATGNMIRVIRTPGAAETSDSRVLSLNEVTAIGSSRLISFTSNRASVTPGDPVTLSWVVTPDVTGLQIDNGVGNVLANTTAGQGSIVVNPGPNAATTYQLTATDASGSSVATTTIAVVNEPLIYSFTADGDFIPPGSNVNLSWDVGGNATSLTLNGANVAGSSGTVVSPTSDTDYVLVASNANGTITRTISVKIIQPGVPVISEFMAANDSGLIDVDGNQSDWIELYNPGADPAPLAGFYLTDDPTDLTKWVFPNVTMAPGSYLIVFASGNSRTDPAGELHTNFSLSADGEYLALVKPDGSTIDSEFSPTFPSQQSDVSYGLDSSTTTGGYFLTPTPGATNGETIAGFVKDTSFSHDRGFYSGSIQLEITSMTPGAQIRYTTDGTEPTSTTGSIYSTSITINQTTTIRAAAYKDGFEPTNVDTQTYIFKADVIADSNMDTGITQDSVYGPQLDAALTAIPSIALTFPGDIEREEKEVAIELINFEDGHKQVNAGMERFGSYNTDFAKRGMRINFRSKYGPGKLDFDLFENHVWKSFQPAEKYDAIELRAGNHDMSQRGAYLSNRYADDALLDMGQIAPHGRFVHVYVNGRYWGQYHLRERWNASMLSEYFGGDKDDYEAINANNSGGNFQTGEAYDGTGDQWEATQTLINGSTPFTSARSHLDIIDLIDFMLLWTNGNAESEFRAAGSVPLGVPFKFYMKDGDGFLRNPAKSVDHQGPLSAMSLLASEGDPDYEMLLADRIQKHYFNDGELTPAKSIERLQERVNETQLSIIAECARWGYRTPASWQSYQDNLINNQFPGQTASMITKFKNAGMYPAIDAPVYNQHGGTAPGLGPTISVTDTNLKVYYIFGPLDTDPDPYRHSLDPRLPGGGINPAATVINYDGTGGVPTNFVQTGDSWSYLDDGSNQGTAWRAKSFNHSSWASGPSELGYGDGDEATVVGFVDVDPNTNGIQKNVTTYFRKSDINIADPSQYENFTINYWYDDAIAIYVNGVEVERVNLNANAAYDDFSTGTVNDNAFGTITLPISHFSAGNNTIAVEVHQRSQTSSDISFNLNLVGNLPGSGQSGFESDEIPVTASGWLLSRTYNTSTGEWSALNEAFFTPDPIDADATNLVVSEVNYNPADASTSAELAITTDKDDFEFVELKNVSPFPVDVSGVAFTQGINFTFGPNNVIPAGGRLIIVKNKAAFSERYSSALSSVRFGTDSIGSSEYSGNLSNGGEQIILTDAAANVIHDFTYDDVAPWPTSADGNGFSMVLLAPVIPIPDHNVGSNWAASAQPGGNPGAASPAGFAGNPDADVDGDGFKAIIEYALGTSDTNSHDTPFTTGVAPYTLGQETKDYFTISFKVNQHTRNALTVTAQISEDLSSWNGAPDIVLVSETDNGDGTTSFVYRSAVPYGERPSGREFMRIKVNQ